jgi:hypothetical protein
MNGAPPGGLTAATAADFSHVAGSSTDPLLHVKHGPPGTELHQQGKGQENRRAQRQHQQRKNDVAGALDQPRTPGLELNQLLGPQQAGCDRQER